MKKILTVMISFIILLSPVMTKALDISGYTTMNLEETLADEGIEKEFSNYKENSKQVPIYMFRGKGCAFCQAFLNYINSITSEYGDKFKLVSFETWKNSDNDALLDKVSNYLDEPAEGVPYIIIGNEVFPGYNASFNEDIKKAIDKLYKSSDRYDVFAKIDSGSTVKKEVVNNSSNNATTSSDSREISSEEAEENRTTLTIILWNLFITFAGTMSIVFFVKSENKRILKKIEEIKKLRK